MLYGFVFKRGTYIDVGWSFLGKSSLLVLRVSGKHSVGDTEKEKNTKGIENVLEVEAFVCI